MSVPGLIVALDDPDLVRSERLAEMLAGRASAFKIGLTLFGACGPEAIEAIGVHGPVFCDLKLHDIPNQVASASTVMADRGVWMFTVHASGGAEMIASAVEVAASGSPPPIVAAVTVLTSMSPGSLSEVGQGGDPSSQAVALGRLAVANGARALVCSGEEIATMREVFGSEVLLVVPGVRRAGESHDDQARIVTPAAAAELGADYVVVGRPIIGAADPGDAAERILAELAGISSGVEPLSQK